MSKVQKKVIQNDKHLGQSKCSQMNCIKFCLNCTESTTHFMGSNLVMYQLTKTIEISNL